MKKKKIFLSLLLVLTLALVLLPGLQTKTEAAAADSIQIGGQELPSGYYRPLLQDYNYNTEFKPSGSYYYYKDGVLTLYNVVHECLGDLRVVYAEGDLTVNITGSNSITSHNANAIRTTGTLKFTGSGSLKVTSGYDAIYSSGNMEFAQTGTVTA